MQWSVCERVCLWSQSELPCVCWILGASPPASHLWAAGVWWHTAACYPYTREWRVGRFCGQVVLWRLQAAQAIHSCPRYGQGNVPVVLDQTVLWVFGAAFNCKSCLKLNCNLIAHSDQTKKSLQQGHPHKMCCFPSPSLSWWWAKKRPWEWGWAWMPGY